MCKLTGSAMVLAVKLLLFVQNVLGKAHARNQELTQAYQREMYRIPPDMPWWSAGLPVRNALQGVADTLSRCPPAMDASFPIANAEIMQCRQCESAQSLLFGTCVHMPVNAVCRDAVCRDATCRHASGLT